MNELLLQSGLDKGVIIILLMLPVVATLIGAARHILGLRSLGIYLALVTTFIFFKIGNTPGTYYSDPWMGLRYGIPLILLIFGSTLLVYWMIRGLAIHYYPKLALVILGVSIILLVAIMVLSLLNFKNILLIDTFSLVLIVTVSEKYFATLARKNLKTTIFISLESIFLAALCYLVISWPAFQDLLVNYPYLLLILIPFNIFVGNFTGLRLSEYLRFWGIITDKN